MIKILAVVAAILLVHNIYLTVLKVKDADTKKEKWRQALWLPLESWILWAYFLLGDLKDIFG